MPGALFRADQSVGKQGTVESPYPLSPQVIDGVSIIRPHSPPPPLKIFSINTAVQDTQLNAGLDGRRGRNCPFLHNFGALANGPAEGRP